MTRTPTKTPPPKLELPRPMATPRPPQQRRFPSNDPAQERTDSALAGPSSPVSPLVVARAFEARSPVTALRQHCRGGQPEAPAEIAAELRDVAEAQIVRDLFDAVGRAQFLTRGPEALVVEPGLRRLTHGPRKHPLQVPRRDAQYQRQLAAAVVE